MALARAALLLLFAWSDMVHAADKTVSEFQAIVGRLERFFQDDPLLYDVQLYTDSPTGLLIFGYRYRAGPLRYDVTKTNSLVTPVLGTISFNLSEQSSKRCGVIPIPYSSENGAASIEEAQAISIKSECWDQDVRNTCAILATYRYAGSKWEFHEVTSEPSGCALLVNYASGTTRVGARIPSDLNVSWRKLNYGVINSSRR